jgi:hypothetical protein
MVSLNAMNLLIKPEENEERMNLWKIFLKQVLGENYE